MNEEYINNWNQWIRCRVRTRKNYKFGRNCSICNQDIELWQGYFDRGAIAAHINCVDELHESTQTKTK